VFILSEYFALPSRIEEDMKLTHKSSKNHDRSLSELKEMMTAAPITLEHYSTIMRKKVEVRRMIEDALEEARMRRNSVIGN
jgi:hypothetical protein